MKKLFCFGIRIGLFLFILLVFFACETESTTEPENLSNNWLPITENVNGELTEIQGIPVLKLWGTHYEQGYAHGYLKAPDILYIINECIRTKFKGITESVWDNAFMASLQNLNIEDRFVSEFRGMLDGMNARAENEVVIPVLERKLKLEDILIINCFHEVMSFNCSAFAAWGNMTEDAEQIIAKNNDWFITSFSLHERLMLCVRLQDSETTVMNTISITVPGLISMGAGINSYGITALFLDANGLSPTQTSGITPRGLSEWEALEKTHRETAITDFENTLKSHHLFVASSGMVGFPKESNQFEACVFEYDGNYSADEGVTVRHPESSESYIICTNHFRERRSPVACWRYESIEQELDGINESNGAEYLTVEKAWDILSDVPMEQSLLYYSIVYEPEKGLLHLAFSKNQNHAPDCEKVTFVIDDLLNN